MRPTSVLHKLGQSLWLDNITRELLNSGMLQRFIEEFSVTGRRGTRNIIGSQRPLD
jgi:transaldolase